MNLLRITNYKNFIVLFFDEDLWFKRPYCQINKTLVIFSVFVLWW
jgi:hypothetical protein